MRVELLWWEGCPSHPRALHDLRDALREEGEPADAVEVRHVGSDEEARRERFIGSPTIRIDGEDVVPPTDVPFSLNCRIYRLRDGRVSPVPDPEDVRETLRRIKERQ